MPVRWHGAQRTAPSRRHNHTRFLSGPSNSSSLTGDSIFMGKRLQKSAQMVARPSAIEYHSWHTLLDSFAQGATFLTHGRTYVAAGLSVVIALSIACGRTASTTVSPTSSSKASTDATATAADGTTLKVSAPTPVTPLNDEVTADRAPTLIATAANREVRAGRAGLRFRVVRRRRREDPDGGDGLPELEG